MSIWQYFIFSSKIFNTYVYRGCFAVAATTPCDLVLNCTADKGRGGVLVVGLTFVIGVIIIWVKERGEIGNMRADEKYKNDFKIELK